MSMCEIHVTTTASAQDRSPGKPRSFQKAVSSSRRGFLQGRRQQWSASHGARGSFTATVRLLLLSACQYFIWILWKHNEMVISKITSCVQVLSRQRKGSKTTSLCSRSARLLKVGRSCSRSLPEPTPEDQVPTNSPSHFSFWYFIIVR